MARQLDGGGRALDRAAVRPFVIDERSRSAAPLATLGAEGRRSVWHIRHTIGVNPAECRRPTAVQRMKFSKTRYPNIYAHFM
jgi:hypothetical protein